MKKLAIIVAVVVLVLLFYAFDLQRYLTLEALKQSQSDFLAFKAQSPWLFALAGFALYVMVAALSLPGALVMTLAMGAMFGLIYGTLLVSFASSIGATLAFLASRYVLRDAVQQLFGDRLQAINAGLSGCALPWHNWLKPPATPAFTCSFEATPIQ